MRCVCVQTIYTLDLEKSVGFYVQGLGYEIAERYGNCIVQLKTDGIPLIVEQVAEGEQERVVLAFQSFALEDDIETLRKSGAHILHAEPQPCPVGRYVSFQGPDHVVHDLLEFSKNG